MMKSPVLMVGSMLPETTAAEANPKKVGICCLKASFAISM